MDYTRVHGVRFADEMDARERHTAGFHPEGVPFEKLFLVSVASLAPRNTSNRRNIV